MAAFNLVLDTRVLKKKNQYNLAIRVNMGSEQMYLNIAKITQEQYDHVFEKKSMDKNSVEFRQTCAQHLAKSERVFINLKPFDKQEYRRQFFNKEPEQVSSLLLKDLFENFILKSENLKPASKAHNKYSRSVFETFSPDISVLSITPNYINRFVKERLDSGVSQCAIDSNLRDLRRIINYFSNEDNIIPTSFKYPFGKGGYSISSYYPRKLVMTNDEIKKVAELNEFESVQEEYARDIWLFLYRCNGINFADLLRMRWDNIHNNYIVFFRKKTETTRKNNKKEIIVPVSPLLKELMDKIGVKDSPFVLGKLKEGYSNSMFENKSKKMKKIINNSLSEIGKRLEISVPLMVKTARDSYATTLRRAGVSKDDIGEMLGHSNSIVTEHYLASIDMESTFEINKHLF
ncbi:MAG: tyrosine-type recombinase/integrase [Bacteroidetes bacterium]|nr:tyrosine-type recombinase/integrase [Bacteroidota bacterium]